MPTSTTPPPYVTALLVRVAANLKAKRKARNLSQADLASLAGVQDSYISMLERGQRAPPLDTLAILAHALNVNVRDLLA